MLCIRIHNELYSNDCKWNIVRKCIHRICRNLTDFSYNDASIYLNQTFSGSRQAIQKQISSTEFEKQIITSKDQNHPKYQSYLLNFHSVNIRKYHTDG